MAEDWTAGYVTEIGYSWAYFPEINPLRVKIALVCAGIAPPPIQTACELGFGQGLSLNLLAAGGEVEWHGNDFNPSHAAVAREMAGHSGAGAQLSDESFAEFRQRGDLPQFDYIALHGVWSWVSDQNRREIVDFIRAKLKVGGVCYVSYNVQPGWSGFIPLRNLMMEYLDRLSPSGRGISNRIGEAFDFAKKLIDTDPLFAKAAPGALARLEGAMPQDRSYLAHEFFNRDWHPMSFLDLGRALDPAKLGFACSANFFEHVSNMTMTAGQNEFINTIPDAMLRQQLMDFMSNQLFRRDYWIRGARRLTGAEQMEHFNDCHVVLARHVDDCSLKVKGPIGEATLNEEIYRPLLDLLADNRVHSIGDIIRKQQSEKRTVASLLQALLVLMGDGQIAPANGNPPGRARRQCDRLNKHIKRRSRDVDEIHFLASPVTGGGVPISRINQLFVLGLENKAGDADQLARFVWQALSARNQRLVHDGKTLEGDEESLAELRKRADVFLAKSRPVYAALGIQ